jgi:hypothetical protein
MGQCADEVTGRRPRKGGQSRIFCGRSRPFLLGESQEIHRRMHGIPGYGSTDLLGRPWGSGEMHGGPVNGVVLKQTAGGVIDPLTVGEVGRGSKGPDVAREIGGGSETVNSIVN